MIGLAIAGTAVACASGVPGLFFARSSRLGERLSTALLVAGCVCGFAAAALSGGGREAIDLRWPVLDAALPLSIDGLSAMFLMQIFLLGAVGAVYGLGYWSQSEHPENGRKLRLFYGLMTGGMAILAMGDNAFAFILGWEVMAAGAFFAISTEDHDPKVRATGIFYLVVTHVATLALFAIFCLARMSAGSWSWAAIGQTLPWSGMGTAMFVLALIAFGLKAGMMPLHIWLPSAHANAPSHVSALMSGMVIKTGIYGLVRFLACLPGMPLWWGIVLLALGVLSGVLGVAFAIGQHDLKRLLAYHSVENIGIIVMGIGVAAIGRSLGRPDLVALGLAGALLHVWNHGLFKGLLFLSAGSVIHATHTREIDHLGGLGRRMPLTSAAFLVGAVAICGLPPLNGFVSEFLVYSGLFHATMRPGGASWLAPALAAPGLALVGALATACFVKVFGAVFLGQARSGHAEHARESGAWMLVPMGVLAGLCAFIGLFPEVISPWLDRAVSAWAPEMKAPSVASAAPLRWIGIGSLGLVGALAAVGLLLRHRLGGPATVPTWGCGYLLPTPRMQYTSSSFAATIVGLFGWALWPVVRRPAVEGVFPKPSGFASEVPDVVLDRAVMPASRLVARIFGWGHRVQSGALPVYLLYILVTLLVLLVLVARRGP